MSKEHKKTRRKYTYKERINILNEFKKSKYSTIEFAKIKNIPTRTFQNWTKNEKK